MMDMDGDAEEAVSQAQAKSKFTFRKPLPSPEAAGADQPVCRMSIDFINVARGRRCPSLGLRARSASRIAKD